MRLRHLAASLLAIALAAGPGAAPAQDGRMAPALDFLVQSNCIDPSGRVVPGLLPTEPRCTHRRPVREGDPLGYRKHDWPATAQAGALPQGYQASDAYLATLLGRQVAVMTFDFGADARRAFGRFDPGADGGDAAVVQGDTAVALLTEDGGGGVQWFIGPACRTGALAPGWLFFGPGDGQAIAELGIARSPRACPAGFSRALTRWTRRTIDMPALASGRPAGRFRAEMIVSDHFSHPDPAASNHLERFWFARGLGRVRWERWQNPAQAGAERERWEAQGRWLAGTGRCPEVEGGGPPAPGWVLVDCRTWTNFVPADGVSRPAAWPTLEANR